MIGRVYYGWVLTVALGATAAVAWGVLYYAFPVFIVPMGDDLGWSRVAITGALSIATLVAGIAAVPVGRWVDRRGARSVMTAGSVAATATLLLWSRVTTLEGFYSIAVLLGLCQAMLFYEPAFAVIANWFERQRARALAVLTFLGGFASVIFVPIATILVEVGGWRSALAWLAAIIAVVTLPPHVLLVRRRPREAGLRPAAEETRGQRVARSSARATTPDVPYEHAIRSRSFFWLALAFGVSAFATTGLTIHLIPLLIERGHTAQFAGTAMAAIGLVALPGRLVLTPLADAWPSSAVASIIFGLQALAVGALLAAGTGPGVWMFVILFGFGFGAIAPTRAALAVELFGPSNFGRIGGWLALMLAIARAGAPVGLSLLHTTAGGYAGVLWVLVPLMAAPGAAVLLVDPNPWRNRLSGRRNAVH